jgi:hypothetical protein
MKISIVFIAIASLAFACSDGGSNVEEPVVNEKKAQEDSLYHAVMEGHDVGMAKMGKLKRGLSQVQQKLDSIAKLPAAKIDTVYRNTLLSVQTALSDAEGHMNHWMENFKLDSAKDNTELRIKYLQGEKATVAVVRDKILNSIQRADSVLRQ